MFKVNNKDIRVIASYCLDDISGNFENIVNFEVDLKQIKLFFKKTLIMFMINQLAIAVNAWKNYS